MDCCHSLLRFFSSQLCCHWKCFWQSTAASFVSFTKWRKWLIIPFLCSFLQRQLEQLWRVHKPVNSSGCVATHEAIAEQPQCPLHGQGQMSSLVEEHWYYSLLVCAAVGTIRTWRGASAAINAWRASLWSCTQYLPQQFLTLGKGSVNCVCWFLYISQTENLHLSSGWAETFKNICSQQLFFRIRPSHWNNNNKDSYLLRV